MHVRPRQFDTMVPTSTGKPAKMRVHFAVREKSTVTNFISKVSLERFFFFKFGVFIAQFTNLPFG